MAPDLLSTIAGEIEERLAQLRPLNAEYEQLLVAAEALESERAAAVTPPRRAAGRRAPAPRATRGRRATATPKAAATPQRGAAARTTRKRGAAASATTKRSARGAAREAILGALDHGSHTVAELAIVTAMKPANISGNLRRLLAEGAVHKTGREGKTAYALPGKG